MIHGVLHLLVPGLAAWLLFRERWPWAWLVMVLTLAVDLDHLLATPIYDAQRCSLGFHPLHSLPAIGAYLVATMLPSLRLVGVGLLIHMALDGADCLWIGQG